MESDIKIGDVVEVINTKDWNDIQFEVDTIGYLIRGSITRSIFAKPDYTVGQRVGFCLKNVMVVSREKTVKRTILAKQGWGPVKE